MVAAQRGLPAIGADARDADRRAADCRESVSELIAFYRAYGCRMARLHVLTSCAIALGDFWRASATFAQIGAAVMPVRAGRPSSPAWGAYVRACEAGRPVELRDELWLAAHMQDIEAMTKRGLLDAFRREATERRSEPIIRLLDLHCAFTLGERHVERQALCGAIAGETAIAETMKRSLPALVRGGLSLIRFFVFAAVRAVVFGGPAGQLGDRRLGFELLRSCITALCVVQVFRRGVRLAQRGRTASSEDAWELIAEVVGPRTREVSPDVVRFYENPSRYSVQAWLTLHTLSARVLSFVAARLTGQGLYETTVPRDARFRVFRRADGSMHFVRELYCSTQLRVFDSDFVVRRGPDGAPVLAEVFPEQSTVVEMETRPLPRGGLSIRGKRVRFHGWVVPTFGLDVGFVCMPRGDGVVAIDGHLRLRPKSGVGRFVLRTLLRRPEALGCIHYVATPKAQSCASTVRS